MNLINYLLGLLWPPQPVPAAPMQPDAHGVLYTLGGGWVVRVLVVPLPGGVLLVQPALVAPSQTRAWFLTTHKDSVYELYCRHAALPY